MSFEIKVLDHEKALDALADYDVDLVLVFRPPFMANFQPLMTLDQQLVALMRKGTSTGRSADHTPARLLAVSGRACRTRFGGRQMIDEYCARTGVAFQIAVQSNSFEMLRGLTANTDLVSFQIAIGASEADSKLGIVTRAIDDRDVPRANLVLGQLRERNLPVAAAVFAQSLVATLDAMRAEASQPPARKAHTRGGARLTPLPRNPIAAMRVLSSS